MNDELRLLVPLFFTAALIYSSVGFGGGSAYLALLVLFAVQPAHVPVLALICNLVVVSSGTYHFVRAGHFKPKLLAPFLMGSVPAAYLGGLTEIDTRTLQLGSAAVLGVTAALMLLKVDSRDGADPDHVPDRTRWLVGGFAGAALGWISGVVGIGGGIFLAPLLYAIGWGKAKQIAAAASVFILLNSLAGLAGQFAKAESLAYVGGYAVLFLTVLVAGQIGSRLGSSWFSALLVKQVTAVVVLAASIRMLLSAL